MEYMSAIIFRSILYPALVFGMPRKLFLLIGITTLVMVVSLGQIWFAAVTLVLLLAARFVSKDERFIFEIYMNLIKFPKELD